MTDILSFLTTEGTSKIFEAFNKSGFEIKYVGGCVRDAILGKKADDIDFATNALPEKIKEILDTHDMYHFDSGIKHGTITAVFDKVGYEITTLRHDVDCDGRHATVEFTDDWKLDAERRDFTFNALYCDKNGKIYDYFDGINNLKNGQLRFIGSPDDRIKEDYLRILRAFRFYNRYCVIELSDEIKNSIKKHVDKISDLSGERIQSEVIKTLECGSSDIEKNIKVFEYFNELGVSEYVFLKSIVDFSYLRKCESLNGYEKLAILSRYNAFDLNGLQGRWHLSNKNFSLMKLVSNIRIEQDLLLKPNKYRYIYRDCYNCFLICCVIEGFIKVDELKKFQSIELSDFKLKADVLIKRGILGRQLGTEIERLKNIWLDKNCEIEIEDLLVIGGIS
jgi:poly(A) polymerase